MNKLINYSLFVIRNISLVIILLSSILLSRECLIDISLQTRSTRPEKDTLAISPSGHFYIHYDLDGINAPLPDDFNNNDIPDYIDQMSETFTYVYNKEINGMEYYQPPGDGWLPSDYDNGGSGNYDVLTRF